MNPNRQFNNAMETVQTASANDALSKIFELLKQHRMIASIWSIEDVKSVRPDLSDDQAWQVLQQCDKTDDSETGLSFSFIEYTADEIFPHPAATSVEEESRD